MAIPMIMVDRHFAQASALFNPNAFSEMLRGEAASCGDLLAILTHSAEIVMREPGLDRSRLLKEVRENRAFEGLEPRTDKLVVLVIHNLSFLSGLQSALIALKSLLDLYSRLIAKALVPSASVFGFNEGNFRGRKVSGGRFLKWIDRSAPRSFESREKLVSILLSHVDEWLNEAVSHRNAVVHDGFIPGLTEAMVPFVKPLAQLQEIDVIPPRMPDGMAVEDYCQKLVKAMRTLISETLPLIPGIDLQLISLEKTED